MSLQSPAVLAGGLGPRDTRLTVIVLRARPSFAGLTLREAGSRCLMHMGASLLSWARGSSDTGLLLCLVSSSLGPPSAHPGVSSRGPSSDPNLSFLLSLDIH